MEPPSKQLESGPSEGHPDRSIPLPSGGTVGIVGGGPAGAFLAIHLLRLCREVRKELRVVIFERQRRVATGPCQEAVCRWKGCNYCAGGLSPRFNDILRSMGLTLPGEVIQNRIRSITIQGYWKNIELDVPPGREVLSVFRGSRPTHRTDQETNFDSFLLDQAVEAGAELIAGEVVDVERTDKGKAVLSYQAGTMTGRLETEFVAFATGVNQGGHPGGAPAKMTRLLERAIPGYAAPEVRRALIFELEAEAATIAHLEGELHFVEYGSARLPLEMCSLLPKRGYITVVLVGEGVDRADNAAQDWQIVREFLELPHIRKLVPQKVRLGVSCLCKPNLVMGSARQPYGTRAAALGDLATSRLYKDGILSAAQMACALAKTLVKDGVDAASLQRGYGPALRRIERDNRFARRVFLMHRIVFSSSVLSRVLYQAAIGERKALPGARRRLESILWRIASGDDDYENIYRSMIRPAVLSSILRGGLWVTLRNYVTEKFFGLDWDGFGRFTTGVARERFQTKRAGFSALVQPLGMQLAEAPQFERMYTIKVRASTRAVLEQLGRFGEEDRQYLKPRWVKIRRTHGQPNQPGCVIKYHIGGGLFSFSLVLERVVEDYLAVYRVQDGFARGGVLIFEIEKLAPELCALSIYVAFDFAAGRHWATYPFWWCFRLLFPAFVHDVLWNHSLCQLKDVVEA